MVAAVGVLGLLAGLAVAVSKPLQAHATAPTPGIVTTFAGGSTTGWATSIGQSPSGLARWGSTLFTADSNGDYVYALDTTTGVESVYAGNGQLGSTGDGGQATAAAINYPRGLALDSAGDLFIATDDRVREVTPAGVITTVAGAGGELSSAQGVSVDSHGNVFIADAGHNQIKKVNASDGSISIFAGTGTAGSGGDNGLATAAQLKHPESVYVDATGNVWIADTYNNLVREVDSSTNNISTVAGTRSAYGATCAAMGVATAQPLFDPSGVTTDGSGNILIADQYDQCVHKLSGTTLSNVAGVGPSTGPLGLVQNAISDGAGAYYISYGYQVVHGSGTTFTRIAGSDGSTCAVHGIGGQATAAMLCWPMDVKLDGAGDTFVADHTGNVVLKIDPAGILSLVAGTGQMGMAGDNGPATSAQLNGPSDLALDTAGNLYISDYGNSAVRRVDHATGVITTFAGTLGSGGLSVDPGPATSAKLFGPTQLAFDGAGNLLIADSGNGRIRKVTPGGTISTFAGGAPCCATNYGGGAALSAYLYAPTAVAVDSAGNVFIGQTAPMARVDPNGKIWTYAANWNAWRLAIGPADRVVSTGGQEAALMPASGAPIRLAGSITTYGGFSGDGGPALAAQFGYLYGVALDGAGDIFVADMENHRIRRVQAYAAPAAPTGVTASAGTNSASVQWTGPADTGGLPIIGYTVNPHTSSPPHAPVTVTGAPPQATVAIHQLINGAAYTFGVTASNGWQAGPESVQSVAVTPSVTAPRLITTLAGSVGIGMASTLGQLPYGLAAGSGHVYVGDLANPVLRDINASTGQETVFAGNDGYGYSGDGGPATSAMMQGAGAVADCGGSIVFADTANYVIRAIDGTGKIRTIAGTGQPGFSGDGGPGTNAKLSRVLGLACRADGGLYISDSDNGRVRILTNDGTIYTWWSGLSFPTGIVELQNLDDVAVSDTGANLVLELTDGNAYLVAGTGQPGDTGDDGPASLAALNDPRGLALTGTLPGPIWLYVVDRGNNRVRLIDSSNGYIHPFASNCGTGPGYGVQALNQPSGIAMGDTTLYIADSGNLRVCAVPSWGGSVLPLAGNGTMSFSGDGGPAAAAQLSIPYAVAIDAAGNEYIADNLNNVVRKVDTSGIITTFAGNGVAGLTLNDPRGVAVDAQGDVYISDWANHRVSKVTPGGTIANFASINAPEALAVDSSGSVYVADTANNRVWKVNQLGSATLFGGTLNQPSGLAIGPNGEVYIADTGNNRVRGVDRFGKISTFAGNGTAGFAGDGGSAKGAELDVPSGLAVDGAGNVYIADSRNETIRVVDPFGTITSVIGICGIHPGFEGDGGPASTAAVNVPVGIVVDSAGDLYVADAANNRVRAAFAVVGGHPAACQGPTTVAPAPRSTAPGPIGSPGPRISSASTRIASIAQPLPSRAGWPAAQPVTVTAGTGRQGPVFHAHAPSSQKPAVAAPGVTVPAPHVTAPLVVAPPKAPAATIRPVPPVAINLRWLLIPAAFLLLLVARIRPWRH
jgi:sugar lactone lactonase YvrE